MTKVASTAPAESLVGEVGTQQWQPLNSARVRRNLDLRLDRRENAQTGRCLRDSVPNGVRYRNAGTRPFVGNHLFQFSR